MKDPPRFFLGLLLTLTAGWLAAAGFLEFGGLYVSFMSGNTVQAGLGAAEFNPHQWTRPLSAIAAFVAGSAIGSAVALRAPSWAEALNLALEAAALAGAASLFGGTHEPRLATIALLAAALGLQNQIVSKHRADNAGTTFVTGTLFRLGDALGRGLAGGANAVPWGLFLAVSLSFAVGAAAGAFVAIRAPDLAFALPAGLVGAMAVVVAVARVSHRAAARRASL